MRTPIILTPVIANPSTYTQPPETQDNGDLAIPLLLFVVIIMGILHLWMKR
jgi:hypothetical protein